MKKLIINKLSLLVYLLIPVASYSQPVVIPSEKIWDQAPHNAFTDLVRYNGSFYCTFREGSGHVPGIDGTIRVLKSGDGKSWSSEALLDKQGYDLRDPSFSLTPDNRLMLLMGGSVYVNGKLMSRTCQVSFYDKKSGKFSAPQPIKIPEGENSKNNWLWRVKWYKGIAYGAVYQWEENLSKLLLVSSEDGINYKLVKAFEIEGRPNETALRFMDDGELMMLVRREDKGRNGMLGKSKYPYQDWKWIDTGFKMGGPNFIIGPGGAIIIGTRTFASDGSHTGLLANDSNGDFKHIIAFPSGKDTSYPGMVIHKKVLFVSYYSGHEGKTSIYLARIPLKELKKAIGPDPASPFK